MAEDWIEKELAALAEKHCERTLRIFSPQPGGMVLDGQGRRLLNFSSNDYLGFAGHPDILKAAAESAERGGAGATASRLICGTSELCQRVEDHVAGFKRYPAALIFGSGFLANIGTISSLVGPGDHVIADRLSHASILDGIRLSGARLHRFHHNDPEHCKARVAECPAGGRRLVITESVFSMDGDCAPLRDLADICEQQGALFMVDEAHATGVFGDGGRGLAHACGVTERVTVSMGTFSKALGSYGGFIACSSAMKRWVVNKARSFIYTTALPPAVLGASEKALSLLEQNPGMGAALLAKAHKFRTLLAQAGLNTGESQSQITPVIVGKTEKAVALSQRILQEGVLAVAIRPPTVPEGKARLRLSVSLAHADRDIERAAEVIISCARQEGLL